LQVFLFQQVGLDTYIIYQIIYLVYYFLVTLMSFGSFQFLFYFGYYSFHTVFFDIKVFIHISLLNFLLNSEFNIAHGLYKGLGFHYMLPLEFFR